MPDIVARRTAGIAGLGLLLLLGSTLLSACAAITTPSESAVVANGNPRQGRQLLRQYGCGGCHAIPGVEYAQSWVAPPLEGWAGRGYIAGRLPNTPEHLIQWIQNPQAIDPENQMPNMGVAEQEARDMAAYLFTLGERTRYDGVTER